MTQANFNVQSRDTSIKGKKLRKEGALPANIYGAGKPSQAVQVDPKKFIKLYHEAGETSLVYLTVDDKKTKIPVLIDEVQHDVFGSDMLHVSFKQVDLKDKITAEIPVVVVGEFDVPEAVLVTVRDTVEVEALPTDFPEKFEINAEELTEIGQTITLADLKYDKSKVELVLGDNGEEAPVVLVQEMKEEVEEEEGETEGEEAAAEGEATEAPAGGEKPEGESSEAQAE